MEALLAHQGRPGAGQLALRRVRVLAEQILARDQAQHGVSQELQALVALDPGAPVLVGIGDVDHGGAQQLHVPERVAQPLFQFIHVSSFLQQLKKETPLWGVQDRDTIASKEILLRHASLKMLGIHSQYSGAFRLA